MFDIATNTFNFDSVTPWIDLIVSALCLIGVGVLVFRLLKRRIMVISYCVIAPLILVAWFFDLELTWGVLLGLLVLALVIFLTVNISEVRPHLSNALNVASVGSRGSSKIFDRHALYVKIDTAVRALSKSKTGAIMTFERSVELSDAIKSGTILNAPVTPELLMTIFYPGTRLHDGAVVIRRDYILAASVYYTPTTKPLTGKFGSRHRAAIGISEITDAVTVVVSEETGRVSLAIGGELIPVNVDDFLRTFEDYMFAEEKSLAK